MGDGDTIPLLPGDANPACQRCTSAMELLTCLQRTGEHPSYRIFGCAACQFVQWIAEQIGGD